MKKAVSLILCLLFCAPLAAAQQRNSPPPPPPPRSDSGLLRDIIRRGAATEQGRARGRAIIEDVLARARAQQPAPDASQYAVPAPSSVKLSTDFSPSFCILGCPPPPANVSPSLPGPSLPAVQHEGLTPDQLSGRAPLPPAQGLPKPGEYGAVVIKGDPNALPFSLRLPDFAESDRRLEEIGRKIEAVTRDIRELERLTLQLAPPATPGVQTPARAALPSLTSASAAGKRPPDIRGLAPELLTKPGQEPKRLIVRSSPKGYYVGSLDSDDTGPAFRVDSVHQYISKHTGKTVCWARGRAYGDVKLSDVWVNCDGLSKRAENVPAPRPATDAEIPDFGAESRRYLKDRFASAVPPTDIGDGQYYLVLTRDAKMYDNYKPPTNFKPGSNHRPPPGQFLDEGPVVPAAPCYEFKVRYFSDDGNAAIGRYIVLDPKTQEAVSSRWGVLPTEGNIVLRSDKRHCDPAQP